MYLSSPLVFSLLAWFPTWKRPLIIIGLVISCLSLGLSSLSMTVPHLIVSQGVCYAIGGGLCYSPTVSYVDEWFEKRKGFAFGIMWVSLNRICRFAIFISREPELTMVAGWYWPWWCRDSTAPPVSARQVRLPYHPSHLDCVSQPLSRENRR